MKVAESSDQIIKKVYQNTLKCSVLLSLTWSTHLLTQSSLNDDEMWASDLWCLMPL